jgi:AraC-like DNA-binding protein
MKASNKRFEVNVIGYRKKFSNIINVPKGVPCLFIFLFYDIIDIKTSTGITKTKSGSMLVLPPGIPVYTGIKGKIWLRSWLRCSGTMPEAILKENNIPLYEKIDLDSHEMNEKFLLDIHREMHHPKGGDLANAEDIFKIWMRNLKRELKQPEPAKAPEKFLKARQYIELNFLERFTLDDLSRKCFISKPHLCKGFRQYFETSPVEYAIRLRIQHSLELLKNIDMNISEIARECGFSDVFYFSRAFKKHIGVSPNKYRKT